MIDSGDYLFSKVCYDSTDCYYLLLSCHNNYQLLNGEEILKEGLITNDNPAFVHVVNCVHSCGEEHIQLVIARESGNNYITYNDNEIINEEIFKKPTLRTSCVEKGGSYTQT